MNNLDSALVEMAALAAKWRLEYADHPPHDPFRTRTKRMADELDTLRTRLAGGGDDGRDAVAFRYLRQLSGATYAWTRWLGMDELHHYGQDGDLVQGPHPDWKVEYAYTRPPSEAVAVDDAMVERALQAYHGGQGALLDAHEYRAMRAALTAALNSQQAGEG